MYNEIYDITKESFGISIWIIFLIIVVSVFLVVKRLHPEPSYAIKRDRVFQVFMVFLAGMATYDGVEFYYLRSLVSNNKCIAVEGVVREFRPKTVWSKAPESFVVSGNHFSYSDSNIGNGYDKISGLGGVIKEGMNVRICHHRGKILRLEVREE
jgi:hypothetical protein